MDGMLDLVGFSCDGREDTDTDDLRAQSASVSQRRWAGENGGAHLVRRAGEEVATVARVEPRIQGSLRPSDGQRGALWGTTG